MCLPSILAYILPNAVYTWFLGSHFGPSRYYVVFYLLGFGLNLPYLLLVNYFFYHGKNTLISKFTIFSSLVYLILLALLTQLSLRYVPSALIMSNIILIVLLWRNLKNV